MVSSMINEAIQDDGVFGPLNATPWFGWFSSWHNYPPLRLQRDQEGLRFRHRRGGRRQQYQPGVQF